MLRSESGGFLPLSRGMPSPARAVVRRTTKMGRRVLLPPTGLDGRGRRQGCTRDGILRRRCPTHGRLVCRRNQCRPGTRRRLGLLCLPPDHVRRRGPCSRLRPDHRGFRAAGTRPFAKIARGRGGRAAPRRGETSTSQDGARTSDAVDSPVSATIPASTLPAEVKPNERPVVRGDPSKEPDYPTAAPIHMLVGTVVALFGVVIAIAAWFHLDRCNWLECAADQMLVAVGVIVALLGLALFFRGKTKMRDWRDALAAHHEAKSTKSESSGEKP